MTHVHDQRIYMTFGLVVWLACAVMAFQPPDLMTRDEDGTIIKSVTDLGLAYSACYLRYCDYKCNVSDTKWYPLCHCDKYCEALGDCCYGYQACVKDRLTDDVMMTLLVLGPHVSCKHDDPWLPDNVMVRTCPKSSYTFKRECEQWDGMLPVENQPYYHKTSGLTFRNVFCALCHAMSLDDLIPWGILINGRCQPMDRAGTIVDHILSQTNYDFCPSTANNIDFSITDRRCAPKDKRPERFCDVEGPLRNKCDINRKLDMGVTTYKFVEEACLSYEAPIMVRNDNQFVLFKNSFCVECSNFSTRDLRCPPYYCNLPISVAKPSVKPIQMNQTIRHDLELNLDRLLFVVRSMRRRCRLYPAFRKRLRQDCREGFIKYNDNCIPDLLDNSTYAKPINDFTDILTMSLSLTLPQPIRTVIKGYDMGPELKKMFQRLINLLIPFLNADDVVVTSNYSSQSVIGGTEVTFDGDMSVRFRVDAENQTDALGIDDLVVRMLKHSRTMAESFSQLDPRLTIATGNVSFPIRCPEGRHLIIPLDRAYFSLYRHHYDADQMFRDLVLVFKPSDTKYPIMHGCTKPIVRKQQSNNKCTLMAYSRDDFSAIGDKLVYQYTTIKLDRKDYYVVGNKLYTCIVLPRGQRVVNPIRKNLIHLRDGGSNARPMLCSLIITGLMLTFTSCLT